MKGNTPTCVGKTKRGRPPLFKLEKHPHVRGEDGRSSCYWTAPILNSAKSSLADFPMTHPDVLVCLRRLGTPAFA